MPPYYFGIIMIHYRVIQTQNKVDKVVALCNPYGTGLSTSPDVVKVDCNICQVKLKAITPLGRGTF